MATSSWLSRGSRCLLAAFLVAVTGSAVSAQASNPKNCNIVQQKQDNAHGRLSTSVAAGNGGVSAQTNGGNGVTVHSGNGGVSTSTATTGSGGNTTTVTNSNGNCTTYVNPGDKKED